MSATYYTSLAEILRDVSALEKFIAELYVELSETPEIPTARRRRIRQLLRDKKTILHAICRAYLDLKRIADMPGQWTERARTLESHADNLQAEVVKHTISGTDLAYLEIQNERAKIAQSNATLYYQIAAELQDALNNLTRDGEAPTNEDH